MIARRPLVALLALGAAGCAHAGAHEDFFRAIELDNSRQITELLRRGMDANTRNAKGEPALLGRVNEIIAKAKAEGRLNEFSMHWLKAPLPKSI